jgi:hypothetical protein
MLRLLLGRRARLTGTLKIALATGSLALCAVAAPAASAAPLPTGAGTSGYGGPTRAITSVNPAAGQFTGGTQVSITGPTFCPGNPPQVCAQPVDVTEGQPFTQVIATFTSPDANPVASQFSAEISWGDSGPGSASAGVIVANPDGSFSVIGSHDYAEEGSGEEVGLVHTFINDTGTGRSVGGTQTTPDIADAPLTVSPLPLSVAAVTQFSGNVATFTDADPGGTVSDYTATIDWGDGSPVDTATVVAQGGGFAVTGSHTYATAEPFTATVQVTDAGGATASASVPVNSPGTADNDLSLAQPANVIADGTNPAGATVSYQLPVVTDEDASNASPTCAPASGSVFAIGVTTVTCMAADDDDSNSPVSTSFTVTVTDADLAMFPMPNFTVTTANPLGTVPSYPLPEIIDESLPRPVPSCTPGANSVFPIGTTVVTCVVTDDDDLNGPLSMTFSVTVRIGCPITIIGIHSGPLNVTTTTCIENGGQVTGPVTVGSGASLVVIGGTIGGPLTVSGAANLTLCSSSVGGKVTVQNSTGYVMIGGAGDDGALGCGPNAISGPVKLAGNGGGAEVGGNTIAGPVSVTGTTNSAVATEPGPVAELEANMIAGPLACSGNASIGDDNQPNTVMGRATGQCASGLT